MRRSFDAHERGVQLLVDVLAVGEKTAAKPNDNDDGSGEKTNNLMNAKKRSTQQLSPAL